LETDGVVVELNDRLFHSFDLFHYFDRLCWHCCTKHHDKGNCLELGARPKQNDLWKSQSKSNFNDNISPSSAFLRLFLLISFSLDSSGSIVWSCLIIALALSPIFIPFPQHLSLDRKSKIYERTVISSGSKPDDSIVEHYAVGSGCSAITLRYRWDGTVKPQAIWNLLHQREKNSLEFKMSSWKSCGSRIFRFFGKLIPEDASRCKCLATFDSFRFHLHKKKSAFRDLLLCESDSKSKLQD
jgi:hypothetical protein